MVIRLKSTIDKRNYELLVQLCIFRGDNLNYKTINLVKVKKYINYHTKENFFIFAGNKLNLLYAIFFYITA